MKYRSAKPGRSPFLMLDEAEGLAPAHPGWRPYRITLSEPTFP
jgi:hypothetical protein